jgi:hypothetical protein
MADDQVQRELQLTTPLTEGTDVEALQQALNKIGRRFSRILDFALVEDGQLGEKTLDATFRAAHAMGVARPRLTQIEREHVIIRRVQRVLRTPAIRSDAEKRRGERRRDAFRRKLAQQPSLARVALTLTAGPPHWGASNDVMTQFVEPFMTQRGLPLGSGKRTPAQNQAAGGSNTSDHLTTKRTSAARDFPTFAGEDDARALAKAMGIAGWQPDVFQTFSVAAVGQTFKIQILWGPKINHDDHVHVGMTRV